MNNAVTNNAPAAWYDVKYTVFAALKATGWRDGIVGDGCVTVTRPAGCQQPAGRGAEVVRIMRAELERHGYRVREHRGRDRWGSRYVCLSIEVDIYGCAVPR